MILEERIRKRSSKKCPLLLYTLLPNINITHYITSLNNQAHSVYIIRCPKQKRGPSRTIYDFSRCVCRVIRLHMRNTLHSLLGLARVWREGDFCFCNRELHLPPSSTSPPSLWLLHPIAQSSSSLPWPCFLRSPSKTIT